MIIDDSDSDDDAANNAGTDVAGTAYRENLTSVDGFTRGANGKVKFNKDTKKRRREEDAAMDVDMADADPAAAKAKKVKKKDEPKFGHEFKSKVCLVLFFFFREEVLSVFLCRKLVVMLKRVVWTHMHTCLSPRPLRRREERHVLVLQESGDDLRASLSFFCYTIYSFTCVLRCCIDGRRPESHNIMSVLYITPSIHELQPHP